MISNWMTEKHEQSGRSTTLQHVELPNDQTGSNVWLTPKQGKKTDFGTRIDCHQTGVIDTNQTLKIKENIC